uniref:Uncharacterized protein n=1 Tax=Anguilla anguilla TaxID=7936 RepID=A0A0E9QUH1_ANGAN
MLVHGQKRPKVHHFCLHLFSLGLAQDMHDLSVGRVLTEGPDQISTLSVSNLHLICWGSVKQLEGILEIFNLLSCEFKRCSCRVECWLLWGFRLWGFGRGSRFGLFLLLGCHVDQLR